MRTRRRLARLFMVLGVCGALVDGRGSRAEDGTALAAEDGRRLRCEHGVNASGYVSDRYTWWDAARQPRVAELVRNDAPDPRGHHGGYLRTLSYVAGGTTRTIVNGRYARYGGWGYTVNHYGTGSATGSSKDVAGTYRTVFEGPYHAVHEFRHRVSPGGPVDVTVHWVFATGRSNPLYAVTYDATPSGPDVVAADARGPYGELAFDVVGGPVAGIEWGDRYRFVLTGASPLTVNSTWDYTEPNEVPYTLMWSMAADAEMGVVQTQTFDDHPAGADYGPGQTSACNGRTSASPGSCSLWVPGGLIGNWLWPFQLNNWELRSDGSPTTSRRMAWGMTLGAVGRTSYVAWGRKLSGYPYQSYSVFLVLGRHSDGPTRAEVADVAAARGTRVSASTGSVVRSGPGGVGRTDKVTYSPAGWDHVYAAWTFRADANRVAATFTVPRGRALDAPLLRVLGWTGSGGPAHVRVGSEELAAGTDWFASVDAETSVLWLTVQRRLAGTTPLSIE